MRNIKLTLRYDGTHYSGWQSQKNGKSIQDTIELNLKKITGRRPKLKGSGRTDSGVHAEAQIANFKTDTKIPLSNLMLALNSSLPDDIAVTDISRAPASFDAQRWAKSKVYRYTIFNDTFLDPLIRRYAAKYSFELNISRMRKAASILIGRHDFASFQASDKKERSAVRTIRSIMISRKGRTIDISIEANGFVYNMARSIVGTLVEVGRGRFEPGYVNTIMKKKDRSLAGPTMPAKGLCLVKVRY